MVTGYLLNTFTLTAIMAEGIQLPVHRCGKTIEFSMVLTQGHSANLRIPLSFWEQLGNDDLPPGDLASIHEDDEDGGECHEDEEEEDGETIVLQVAQPTKEDSTRLVQATPEVVEIVQNHAIILVGREGGQKQRLPWHSIGMSGSWEHLFKIIRRDQLEAWQDSLQCAGLADATTVAQAPAPAAEPASRTTLTCQRLLGQGAHSGLFSSGRGNVWTAFMISNLSWKITIPAAARPSGGDFPRHACITRINQSGEVLVCVRDKTLASIPRSGDWHAVPMRSRNTPPPPLSPIHPLHPGQLSPPPQRPPPTPARSVSDLADIDLVLSVLKRLMAPTSSLISRGYPVKKQYQIALVQVSQVVHAIRNEAVKDHIAHSSTSYHTTFHTLAHSSTPLIDHTSD